MAKFVDTQGPRQLFCSRFTDSSREYFPYNFNEPSDDIPSQLGKYVSDVFVFICQQGFFQDLF